MCREVEVTEAEVGEMQPQAKVCPKLGEAGRGGGGGSLLEPLERMALVTR